MSEKWQEQLRLGRRVIELASSLMRPDLLVIYTRTYDESEATIKSNEKRIWCSGEHCDGQATPLGYNRVEGCGLEIKWKSINGLCLFCFLYKHPIMQGLHHFTLKAGMDVGIKASEDIALLGDLYGRYGG